MYANRPVFPATVHCRMPSGRITPSTQNFAQRQLAQGIDNQIYRTAFAAFGAIVPGPRSAFWAGLEGEGLAIQNVRPWVGWPSGKLPHQEAEIMDNGQKHVGLEPALCLLMDGVPRQEIIGHHTPGRASTDDSAHVIKHLTQGMLLLRSSSGDHGQVGRHQRPSVVR